jgi:hypothetical protein
METKLFGIFLFKDLTEENDPSKYFSHNPDFNDKYDILSI